MPLSASSVVMQSCLALVRSRFGSGGGPFLFVLVDEPAASPVPAAEAEADADADLSRLDLEDGFRLPWESTDVLEALFPLALTRERDRGVPLPPFPPSLDIRREPVELTLCKRDGRTSFFCLEAGRISSRSTGTPSETRNRRRIRERIQSGGCSGGGATSWDQRDALRGVRKMGLVSRDGAGRGRGSGSSSSGGKRAAR